MRAHAIVSVLVVTLGISALSTLGCATYHDELIRGQNTLEQNQHEKALAIFRRLENEQSHFDATELARYAYLRGMTDYRMGYRADARHWLAVAQSIESQNKDALPANFKAKLEPTLAELDTQVYAHGIASLDKPVDKPRRRPKSDDSGRKTRGTDDKDDTKTDPATGD
jgi:hypothetical protein